MVSLCPGCHAKVHRAKAILSAMPLLRLELWREQHLLGHEQVQFAFTLRKPTAKLVPLFSDAIESSPIVPPNHGISDENGVTRE